MIETNNSCNCNYKPFIQVRLDFLDFRMGSMVDGFCQAGESFTISTSVNDSHIPVKVLCGTLTSSQVRHCLAF